MTLSSKCFVLLYNFNKTFSANPAPATATATPSADKKEAPKTTPKEEQSAGAGQFSLFGGAEPSATETVSGHRRIQRSSR